MLFDIAPSEMLLTVIVAVVVIGPKDLPLALRTAGRWMGKMRRVSGHFRSGIETMIREAEMADMEKTWREQNEAIMLAHPQALAPVKSVTPLTPTLIEHAPGIPQADAQMSPVPAAPPHALAPDLNEPVFAPRSDMMAGSVYLRDEEPQLPLVPGHPTVPQAD